MSASPTPVAELLADLRQALGTLGVRWYLFGAQAAILHGVARLTADVDVTVALGSRPTAELVAALTRAGFEPRIADVQGFVETTRVLPLVHARSRMPVDVVLPGPDWRSCSSAESRSDRSGTCACRSPPLRT